MLPYPVGLEQVPATRRLMPYATGAGLDTIIIN